MAFRTITAIDDPTDYITLADLKDWTSLDGTAHDGNLTGLLAFVFQWWKREGGNIPETYELFLPCFEDVLYLKKNVATVSYVKYYNSANVLTPLTVDTEYRLLKPDNSEATIEPVTKWPSTYTRSDAVIVRFITSSIDDFDKGMIRQLCDCTYQNRGGFEIPKSFLRAFSHVRGATYG